MLLTVLYGLLVFAAIMLFLIHHDLRQIRKGTRQDAGSSKYQRGAKSRQAELLDILSQKEKNMKEDKDHDEEICAAEAEGSGEA